jgi:signal transduction histidine kinase
LDKQIHALVIEGILIGVIFLVIGFVGIFTLVKRITGPLNKLTQEVKALSRGVAVEEVPVETTDEVGRLALAFNTMVIELKQAEEKLISSREQLRSLAARLAEMEETEKKRLTHIIHDEILQDLTTISINLKVVRSQLPKEIEDLIGLHIDDSESLLEQTIDYLRNVIADLRPSVLDDIGLLATLRWYGKQFSERTGVNLKVQGEEMMTRLPLATEIALFRISQEALTNIAKHAQANQVTVSLKEKAGMIQLNIADDGIGFDYSNNRIRKQAGWGLITMKERATAIGWRLRVESELGKGTQIVVEGKR